MASRLLLIVTLLSLNSVNWVQAALVCGNRAQPPPGSICQTAGRIRATIRNEESTEPFPATSFTECRDVALTRSYAYDGSFTWNTNTRICRTFLLTASDLDFVSDPSSSVLVSDGSCFSCQQVCPDPPGENVVVNPGFERSDSLPGPWKIRLSTPKGAVTPPGLNSSNKLSIPNANGIAFQVLRGLCDGAYFSFSFDYRVETRSSSTSTLLVGTDDGIRLQQPTSSVNWTTVQDFFKVTPISRPVVYARPFGLRGPQREFSIDNVAIVPLSGPPTALAGAPELITNGGFETGELAPFKLANRQPGRVIEDDDGGYVFRFADGQGNTIRQNVTLEVGVGYLFSFDYVAYNATVDPGDAWSAWLSIYGQTSGPSTEYYQWITEQGPGRYIVPFVARVKQATLSVFFSRSCRGGQFVCPKGYVFDFDNVSVKRIGAGG